jgi:FtsP/CotA-like multicopper oxidase with cupredoxin domain/peroxiredoxin/ketosteroid isomerase-like protein
VKDATSANDQAAQETLRQLEGAWAGAVGTNDPKLIGLYFTNEFIFVGARGVLQNRNQHLDDFSTGKLHVTSVEIKDFDAHTYGSFAVVSTLAEVKGAFDGRNISGNYRFMDTWRLMGEQWRAVSRQQTKAPDTSQALPATDAKRNIQNPTQSPATPYRQKSRARYLESARSLRALRTTSITAPTASLQPITVRSANGRLDLEVVVDYATTQIGNDQVKLRTYNGQLVGPVIRAKAGDTLYITLRNKLPVQPVTMHDPNSYHDWNTTNLHFHGLHVAPQGTTDAESDNVLLALAPTSDPAGSIQRYAVKIPASHVAGTFWYHAHRHGSTAPQVASGMAGALIIERDDDQHNLDSVNEISAAAEEIMVLQQIPYLRPDPSMLGEIEQSPDGSGSNEDQMFSPGAWQPLRRYITVNGLRIPTITVAPGEVRRLRVVDSGQREPITLRIEKAPENTAPGPALLQFYEIAADGLATGSIRPLDKLDVFPGYRSDVLIRAPSAASGVYYLVDGNRNDPPGQDTGADGSPEPLRWIAKVIIAGSPMSMTLPVAAELQPHRLTDLSANAITGTQYAFYGLVFPPNTTNYFISRENVPPDQEPNGSEFSLTNPRILSLGKTERWLVGTRNGNNVTQFHPFHIHTNPFLIKSVTRVQNGVPVDVTAAEIGGPTWRDTIAMKQGYTYELLTRYDDFTGSFVNHCHILDHEDHGMMELVRIDGGSSRNPAPSRESAAERDALISDIPNSAGTPSVLVFVKGSFCPHCMTQLTDMSRALAGLNVKTTVISASSASDLQAFPSVPFSLIADPNGQLFKQFGLLKGEGGHATIVRDRSQREVLRRVGAEPFTDTNIVLAALNVQRPTFIIGVRNTDSTDDDYVTWSPAPCQLRVQNGVADGPDFTVTLTNDNTQSNPLGGDVRFAKVIGPGQTATAETLTLSVKQDGTPVDFYLAGGKASTLTNASRLNKGRDAVIEIHQGDATGALLGSQAVMVRVRKDISQLTDLERSEFLNALHDLHVNRNGFENYVLMHRLATGRDAGPDQAHKGSAFITWHRAFLLLLERDLQKSFPYVTLPYWVQGPQTDIFSSTFLGQDDLLAGNVQFDPLNPLYGWNISLPKDPEPSSGPQPMGALQRSAMDHGQATSSFRTWQFFQSRDAFANFIPEILNDQLKRGNVEANPHDFGHGFVGPEGRWMSNCRESNADPVFWVFHCYDDYLWAIWQRVHNRFVADGSDLNSYVPADHYQTGSADALGHHLWDTMWPWDLSTGEVISGDGLSRRPPQNSFGKFPKAPQPFQWPSADASPTPADTIDYQGLESGKLDLGFCYDNLPHGPETPSPVMLAERAAAATQADSLHRLALAAFEDPKSSVETRLQAGSQVRPGAVTTMENQFERIVQDTRSPEPVRQQALQLLAATDARRMTSAAMALVQNPDAPASLAAQGAQQLQHMMHFSTLSTEERRRIHEQFVATLKSDTRPEVQAVVLRGLASQGDVTAESKLAQFLRNPTSAPLSQPVVVDLLKQFPKQWPELRQLLRASNPQVASAAARALAADSESEAERLQLAADRNAPAAVRIAAIQGLTHGSVATPEQLLKIFQDETVALDVREHAAAAFRVCVEARSKELVTNQRSQFMVSLQNMASSLTPGSRLDKLRLMAIDATGRSANN